MHEFSIATSIAEKVLSFAAEQELAQVLTVRLAIGELTHLEPEQLRFCYTSITEATAIAGSELEIEKIEAAVECPHCSYRGAPKYWEEANAFVAVPTLQCPNCGKAAHATRGHECEIRSVQVTR